MVLKIIQLIFYNPTHFSACRDFSDEAYPGETISNVRRQETVRSYQDGGITVQPVDIRNVSQRACLKMVRLLIYRKSIDDYQD